MALFQRLMGLGVPCAPVLTVEEALAQPHTATREMTVELGDYRGPGIAVKLDRTPGSVTLPPPPSANTAARCLAGLVWMARGSTR